MIYNSEIVKDLKKFVSGKTINKDDYGIYESFYGNVFLCRVYRYDPEGNVTGLVDADGKPLKSEKSRRVIPIGIVLRKGTGCAIDINEGDVVALSDDLVGFRDNPQYQDYIMETNAGASRGIEAIAPPPTISNFLIWRKQYGFITDKVKNNEDFSHDDFFTFLFPEGFIKAKIDSKKFTAWLSSLG